MWLEPNLELVCFFINPSNCVTWEEPPDPPRRRKTDKQSGESKYLQVERQERIDGRRRRGHLWQKFNSGQIRDDELEELIELLGPTNKGRSHKKSN